MGHWAVARGAVETRHKSAREAWAVAWEAYRIRSRERLGGAVTMTLIYLGPGEDRPEPVRWAYSMRCEGG